MSANPVIPVAKGTIIYEQGQPCSTMFVLQSGTVGLYLNWATPTQFQILEISKVGTMFGEMGLFEKDPRNATAIALTDCTLLEISSESFPEFVREHPEETIDIILDLSQRFKMALQEIKASQEIIAESLAALKEASESRKDTLKDRIKRISDYLLDIPEDVPPELYLSLNSRFHGTMY
ncbi:MAG: cyclic nucleotide-binding domain-containing protein [Spirochaetales bacterium]|nr:cyclic nucleotide-binding domain-containing protein [Spirochaetales bacterium]